MYNFIRNNWARTKYLLLAVLTLAFLVLFAFSYKNNELVTSKKKKISYQSTELSLLKDFLLSKIKSPFVNIGDTVKEGDVLCVIEAMKLFNEIESEVSGKIIKVLVEDANPVEFDEPLFIVDPS